MVGFVALLLLRTSSLFSQVRARAPLERCPGRLRCKTVALVPLPSPEICRFANAQGGAGSMPTSRAEACAFDGCIRSASRYIRDI